LLKLLLLHPLTAFLTGAVKSALKGNTPSISTPSLSKAGKQARKAGEKITKQVGVTNMLHHIRRLLFSLCCLARDSLTMICYKQRVDECTAFI
jgi:hypothetical protein